MDYLYYWKLHAKDTSTGLIYKLNQNSPVMQTIRVGDDVWAVARTAQSKYSLVGRFTVSETGRNPVGSPDQAKYGTEYFRSTPSLTTYFELVGNDVEAVIRGLNISVASLVLGRSFQGGAAVRQLSAPDREKLVRFAATLQPA